METMLLDRDQALQGFESFRQTILSSGLPFGTKQDYSDWELAVTGIAGMQKEIKQMERLEQRR